MNIKLLKLFVINWKQSLEWLFWLMSKLSGPILQYIDQLNDAI